MSLWSPSSRHCARATRDVKAEVVEAANYSGSWKRLKGTAFTLAIHIACQNLNVVQFFVKYTTKSKCLINHHLQRNIFKGLWFI